MLTFKLPLDTTNSKENAVFTRALVGRRFEAFENIKDVVRTTVYELVKLEATNTYTLKSDLSRHRNTTYPRQR